MKVNMNVTLSDKQRSILANVIDGKTNKRLATRADVRAFVLGVLDRAVDDSSRVDMGGLHAPMTQTLTSQEVAEVERLRQEGKTDSYIRGWLQNWFGNATTDNVAPSTYSLIIRASLTQRH